MAIDILTYPELLRAEQQVFGYDTEHEIGRFQAGPDQSTRLGDGLEIDGLRDYVPGDDARHIDWIATAKRTDGGLFVREHYAEQAPLTVIISDIPNAERYANTPGNPLSARALGFVFCHTMLKVAVRAGAPVAGVWTDGSKSGPMEGFDGPSAPKKVIRAGLQLAARSTEALVNANTRKIGKFRRDKTPLRQQGEELAETIERAQKKAQFVADAARFIIVSNFRNGTPDVVDAIRKIRKSSDVITVQITNPYLRELPQDISVFRTGKNQGAIIESDAQRELYRVRAEKKQGEINKVLKASSTNALTIDTMQPHKIVQP